MFGVIYTYRCILTNNWTSTEKDIITFYNERGASEKNFDIQNNDFGWSHLPFSLICNKLFRTSINSSTICISSISIKYSWLSLTCWRIYASKTSGFLSF